MFFLNLPSNTNRSINELPISKKERRRTWTLKWLFRLWWSSHSTQN